MWRREEVCVGLLLNLWCTFRLHLNALEFFAVRANVNFTTTLPYEVSQSDVPSSWCAGSWKCLVLCTVDPVLVVFAVTVYVNTVERIVFWLISNFRRVLNVVFVLLGDSPASEFYVQTFRNTLFRLHGWCKEEELYCGYFSYSIKRTVEEAEMELGLNRLCY